MEKSARKIFQPTALTNDLLEGATGKGKANLSDFVNAVIADYYLPANRELRKETEFLFLRMENQEMIYPEELKAILARCVDILKDHPIMDVKPLEQVLLHFTNQIRTLRYDYVQIVDNLQNEQLHRLNEILKTVDASYTLGPREFGERSRIVFKNWYDLCRYSEIYTALATIIECENIYYPLDAFRTLELIRQIDKAVQDSNLDPIRTPYPVDLSLTDRYYGLKYEISVYQTDDGYCALSGDTDFANMPDTIRNYITRCMSSLNPYGDITAETLKDIAAAEVEGRLLFRRLSGGSRK